MIDYLKFDIEGSEWKAIPEMAQSGILKKYVKQIAFESHTYYGGSVGHIYLNAVKVNGFTDFISFMISS